MQLCNTKNNHYVPQFYLKSFVDNQGILCYYDKKTDIYYQTKTTEQIAFKRNLYTIKNKITEEDIIYFGKLLALKLDTPIEKMFLHHLVALLNDEFKKLFTVEHKKDKRIELQINSELERMLNSPDISRNQELLFEFYENKFQPIYLEILATQNLNGLKANKENPTLYLAFQIMSFVLKTMGAKLRLIVKQYDSTKICRKKSSTISPKEHFFHNTYFDCIHYLVIQAFRTNKVMNSPRLQGMSIAIQKQTGKTINANNIMFLLTHFHSLNIVGKLIDDNYKIYLLKNKTPLQFITSDHPAVNPYTGIIAENAVPVGYEIFFPLSPTLALLCSNCCFYNTNNFIITIDDAQHIRYWNDLIFQKAERYVYGNSENLLKAISSH